MKFWPLLLANLGRHKRRTLLTMASVALALFLFASLRTVITTLRAAAEFGSARRLVCTNASGLIFPLPVAYAQRLAAVPGVEKVTWANWFGGPVRRRQALLRQLRGRREDLPRPVPRDVGPGGPEARRSCRTARARSSARGCWTCSAGRWDRT